MKQHLTPYMFWIAFVASLGGLLFGFDTAVISGAEGAIQKIYGLSDFAHGFTMATALIGTIIGAFFCGRPAKRFGRLRSLQVIALLYFISAVGSAAIVNWYSFMFFRFIGGLAVGASSVIGPMYIAEISPAAWRGRFVAFFQFNIVLGIVAAYFSNYFIAGVPNDWQWMIGAEAFPALLFCVLLFTLPESPRWLVAQGREREAEAVFDRTGEADVPAEMAAIRESLASAAGVKKERLFQRKFRKPILIAFLIATFNQLSGINAILYYAPRLLEMSGVFRDGAMLQSIIVGLTNLTFTILGMVLIDKVGRKTLLLVGAAAVLGIVVLYNLGVMSYTERYREMAALKVLGFRDRQIGGLLISQNMWMTLIGVIIGVPAGVGVLAYLLKALASEYELDLHSGALSYVGSVALTFAVSLIVGLMISRKNKKIDMVEALKAQE